MKNRTQLDNYLCEKLLSNSLEKARKEILTGWVKVNGETVRDPKRKISGEEEIIVSRPGGEFASRGGYKLNHALEVFGISVSGKIAADIGSSTGGFTDCLLRNGAAKVYAIDNGYGTLAYELRMDPRVVVRERTNIRNLSKCEFLETIDFLTIDLSFISVKKYVKKIKELFSPASGILLIKPQFEAEACEHEKGVVRKSHFHIDILNRTLKFISDAGITIKGLDFSPIKGPAGNIEFLLHFLTDGKPEEGIPDISGISVEAVNKAHLALNC